MKTLNIGILAHVDAGKTSLTERLLFDAGVIDEVGSVDKGSTQTDSLELERRRGITIQSAVVSFTVEDAKINLIDTPGHSDFISEVERVLRVLDGAVLVVSAVEGVQAQTRVLMRTLTRLGIPVVIFVNKIDRMGARQAELLAAIGEKLAVRGIAMTSVTDIGTPRARAVPYAWDDESFTVALTELLAENDVTLLESYLGVKDDITGVDDRYLRDELATQTGRALVCPVFFGSAITGEGVPELMRGIRTFLPAADGSADAPLAATVFKIERGPAGEKIAYVRLYSGTINAREQVAFHRPGRAGDIEERGGKVTAIGVFDQGTIENRTVVMAGGIAKLWGLKDIQIGDRFGIPDDLPEQSFFAPPSLTTVVRAVRPAEQPKLYGALRRLDEQDPFINTRKDDVGREISVCLYGEVQKEVIKATLADSFGVEVVFEETQTIYIEKPISTGAALEEIDKRGHNDFYATVGLRVEPGAVNSGVTYRLGVELGSLPSGFHHAIEDSVYRTLGQGLYGWEVVDCVVTLTHSGFAGPVSTADDFRKVTPLVLMAALAQAGTTVHEPVNAFELEIPRDTTGSVLSKLAEVGATLGEVVMAGAICRLDGTLPTGGVHKFEQQLPGLAKGEGVFLSRFGGYHSVGGTIPVRPRSDGNPLNRKEYLLYALDRR